MIDAFAKAVSDPGGKIPDDIINIGGRFDAYRSNYFTNLINVLGDQFPVTSKLVGQEFFEALVQEYATQSPPTSPLLGLYGEKFADFLEGFEPVQQVPYLPDVARLEWARTIALSVIALPPYQISAEEEILQALQASIQFSPGATLLRSSYPVETIWARHQFEEPDPITDWIPETVAIWQEDGEIHQVTLSEIELQCFVEIDKSAPFMDRLQHIEDQEQVAVMIGTFVKYLNLGFLKI